MKPTPYLAERRLLASAKWNLPVSSPQLCRHCDIVPSHSWQGGRDIFTGTTSTEISRKVSAAFALRKAFMGPVYIVFGDGTEVRVDPFAINAPLLLKTVSDRLYSDDGIDEG